MKKNWEEQAQALLLARLAVYRAECALERAAMTYDRRTKDGREVWQTVRRWKDNTHQIREALSARVYWLGKDNER